MRRTALVLLTMMFASVAAAGEKKPPVADVFAPYPLFAAPGGKWTQDALYGAIQAQRASLAPCWQPALDKDPAATWDALAFLQIDAKGKVESVMVTASGDATLDACVQQGLRAFALPPPGERGAIAVKLHFVRGIEQGGASGGEIVEQGVLAGVQVGVVTTPASKSSGSFRSRIQGEQAAFAKCYRKHVRKGGSPRIETGVQFGLDEQGKLTELAASGSANADLDACVAKVASQAIARIAGNERLHVDVVVVLIPVEEKPAAAGTPARVSRGDLLIGADWKRARELDGPLMVALHGKRGELDACYTAGLKRNKALAGSAVVHLAIGADGKPTAVLVAGLGGPKTEKCVGKALGTLAVAPTGEPFDAAFELHFEPARSDAKAR